MKSNIGVGFPRRVLLRRSLASGLGMLVPGILQGEEAEKSVTDFITPATDRSINQGLRYLAGQQTEDGRLAPVVISGMWRSAHSPAWH